MSSSRWRRTPSQSRIHMLSEMEKLYEGYSKAVKLVMGEARRGQLKGVHGPVGRLAPRADHLHRGH